VLIAVCSSAAISVHCVGFMMMSPRDNSTVINVACAGFNTSICPFFFSSCCCQGDAEACCDSCMHDLQYCLSAARRVASTISQPRRLQSSVTLSSQRFPGRPLALFPSTLPYRAMYGRRHLSILVTWPKYLGLLVWIFSTISSSNLGLALMSH